MSEPTWNGYTAADLVRVNSHELTATNLVSERRARKDERRRHDEEIAALTKHLDEATRIGRHVLIAERAGRKTVRIADLHRAAGAS